MARIEPKRRRDALVRLSEWISRRKFGGTVPEPVELMAHRPLLLHAYSGLELAFERSHKTPGNLKELAEMKAAAVVGCRAIPVRAAFSKTAIPRSQTLWEPTFLPRLVHTLRALDQAAVVRCNRGFRRTS